MTNPAGQPDPTAAPTGAPAPEVGPPATQDIVADTLGGIDLSAMFGDPASGSGHSSVEQTEGGGSVNGGVELGGGAHASIGVPGGPSLSFGAEGEFGSRGEFGAEGRHLEADSSHVDSGVAGDGSEVAVDPDPTGTSADDGQGWQDSSLTLDEGAVGGGGETYLGGGAEASFSAPGMPEFGAGIDGHFGTEGGFEFGGSHLDADTSYGEGEPPSDDGVVG